MKPTPWDGAWQGEYVEVTPDGINWRFHSCLRCGKPLKTPNDEGYGPECKKHRPLDWRTEKRKALAADRELWRRNRSPARHDKPASDKQLSYLASLAQRKRVDVPDVRSSYEASLAIERLKEAEVSAVR